MTHVYSLLSVSQQPPVTVVFMTGRHAMSYKEQSEHTDTFGLDGWVKHTFQPGNRVNSFHLINFKVWYLKHNHIILVLTVTDAYTHMPILGVTDGVLTLDPSRFIVCRA